MPVVAVEVAPAANGGGAVVLVDTCSRAVRRGRCELSRDGDAETPPAAIAIVSWIDHEHRQARIQVGVRREARAEWATRDVYFEPADPELERWRSVGLTIAILIGELPETRALLAEPDASEPSPGPPAASAAPALAPPTPPATAPSGSAASLAAAGPPAAAAASAPHAKAERAPAPGSPAESRPASRAPSGFVSAVVTVGTGLDSGPARRGGGLWAAHSLSPLPLWVPVSVAYTYRPREASLKVDFLTLRVGVGNVWPLAGQRVAIEAEAFFALEQLTATATATSTGRQDSEQRWAPFLGVGVGPIFGLWPPLCVVIEGRFGKSLRTFTLHDAGAIVARTAPWDAALEVGPLLTFQ